MTKNIRKLTKTSRSSLYIIIPRGIIKKYGWREKQKLVIIDKGQGRLEVRDWRRK